MTEISQNAENSNRAYLMATDTHVLVVGAGPVGLFMAAELNRHGVSCRIVDKNDGPTHDSRAASIQARTLEILDSVSLARSARQKVPLADIGTTAVIGHPVVMSLRWRSGSTLDLVAAYSLGRNFV